MRNIKEIFAIGENDKGFLCVVAVRDYDIGEVLMDLSRGEMSNERDLRTIDLGDMHIDHPFGRFTNHSCEPNARVIYETKELIAIKPIRIGDEITFNYMESERSISAPFECECGSSNCVGRVEK